MDSRVILRNTLSDLPRRYAWRSRSWGVVLFFLRRTLRWTRNGRYAANSHLMSRWRQCSVCGVTLNVSYYAQGDGFKARFSQPLLVFVPLPARTGAPQGRKGYGGRKFSVTLFPLAASYRPLGQLVLGLQPSDQRHSHPPGVCHTRHRPLHVLRRGEQRG